MSATTDPGNRSAADIEADVEQTRVRVADTIIALRESMSPGQIMDQVVDYARSSGGADFTRNLGAQVRDNPLPVLLIGAGIGWMLLSNGRQAAPASQPLPPQRMLPPPPPSTGQHAGPGMMERATKMGADLREGVGQTASGVTSSIGQAASGVSSAVGAAASSVGSAISSAASSARDAASSASESVSGMATSAARTASSTHDAARAYGHDATHAAGQGLHAVTGGVHQMSHQVGGQLRQSWNRASTEQPLLLGSLGLALGALIGALLPRTQAEDSLMGEASDAVTQQLGTAAQEQYEQAKEVVSEHVGEVREKLSGTASSLSSMSDAVVEAAEGVREAVGQTTRDLGDSAKAGLDKHVGEEAKPPREPAGKLAAKPEDKLVTRP
jgi:ElaB/YqjD/DUF883 family membrane-anchored ribosome-binding protein